MMLLGLLGPRLRRLPEDPQRCLAHRLIHRRCSTVGGTAERRSFCFRGGLWLACDRIELRERPLRRQSQPALRRRQGICKRRRPFHLQETRADRRLQCPTPSAGCAPLRDGQKAPRRAKSREAEHHHRSSGSLGNPVGNDKGRIGSQLVINPKNEKSVGAKVMGEAGVISKAVVETEIDRAV